MQLTVCLHCNGSSSKYKCVKCYGRICSASCMKSHRENYSCTSPKPPNEKTNDISEKYETEDTVPIRTLKCLGDSVELRDTLKDPYLRGILKELDNTNEPSEAIAKAMKCPEFAKFADECLRVVSGDDKS